MVAITESALMLKTILLYHISTKIVYQEIEITDGLPTFHLFQLDSIAAILGGKHADDDRSSAPVSKEIGGENRCLLAT
jgi:hypothetical protein